MFIPWKQPDYERQSPKTLILGESHHGDAHIRYNYPLEKKTILNIEQQVSNAWVSRFYTKVAATLLGHLPSLEEKGRFWNSVAYHNLITEPLSGPRVGPTDEQWIRSFATLPTVFADLKPDYCICLGYRMWGVLRHRIAHTKIETTSSIGPCGAFWSDAFCCVFHGIMHPSGRGYRRLDWHRYINNLRHARWGSPAVKV